MRSIYSLIRRYPVTTGLILLLGASASVGGSLVAGAQQPVPLEALRCSEGKFIIQMHADLGVDTPGGPQNPRAAAAEFLATEYPHLSPTALHERARTPSEAEYSYEVGGSTLAVVTAAEHGDSWHVVELSACESALHPGFGS